MRKDMGRVVIERPRSGSSNPSLKARRVGKIVCNDEGYEYDGPLRIPSSGNGMRMYSEKIGDKSFSDVLGPINGYLINSCGRKWDDVFSELSRGLGAFSWPLQHIMRFHIDVEVNTYLGVDGKIYAENKYGHQCVSDATYSYRRGEFFVHPISRVLCVAPRAKRVIEKQEPPRRYAYGSRWFVLIKGIWFIGTYRHSGFHPVERTGRHGREYWAEVNWPDFTIRYGKDGEVGTYLFSCIKQASKKELKDLRRLVNGGTTVGRVRHRR